jgi:hypothetical protein
MAWRLACESSQTGSAFGGTWPALLKLALKRIKELKNA